MGRSSSWPALIAAWSPIADAQSRAVARLLGMVQRRGAVARAFRAVRGPNGLRSVEGVAAHSARPHRVARGEFRRGLSDCVGDRAGGPSGTWGQAHLFIGPGGSCTKVKVCSAENFSTTSTVGTHDRSRALGSRPSAIDSGAAHSCAIAATGTELLKAEYVARFATLRNCSRGAPPRVSILASRIFVAGDGNARPVNSISTSRCRPTVVAEWCTSMPEPSGEPLARSLWTCRLSCVKGRAGIARAGR